ncbi:MAG: hypothetical protein EZS26_000167 [Candidatus Ordinivivax streblomastigis]|uniref:Uncharacterized protein n=1 Tax=Candidatus Ordinivivax streblomastigis TaxID=2540710 RepID=A0A5M8P5R6_9BACT|nr:MAG: hypothetical protein EZS26_000167 [Candidatus Ordinivivax streblomastigis]
MKTMKTMKRAVRIAYCNYSLFHHFFIFFIFFIPPTLLSSQELLWKAGVHAFFDNTEFANASVQSSQTMAGVHLSPEIGLGWQEKHRIYVGFDAMHEYGSPQTVDYVDPILYYEFSGHPFTFYMGAFPRQLVLDKYPRMFFQDSIRNYRPIINGLFWEYQRKENSLNIWLDWTGRQSRERHEAFFMGWSGRYNWSLFYAQHFGYMFHFASLKDPVVSEAVHDNGLVWTSLGIDLAPQTAFKKLEANMGWSVGLDRNRDENVWHTPQGFLSEVKIEYRGLGLFNTYYKGKSQQTFYNTYGNSLYWGDPVYRSKEYNRSDFYIQFLKTKSVELKFTYTLHCTERQIFHEQAFYAVIDLNNLKTKRPDKKDKYLWDNWF